MRAQHCGPLIDSIGTRLVALEIHSGVASWRLKFPLAPIGAPIGIVLQRVIYFDRNGPVIKRKVASAPSDSARVKCWRASPLIAVGDFNYSAGRERFIARLRRILRLRCASRPPTLLLISFSLDETRPIAYLSIYLFTRLMRTQRGGGLVYSAATDL